MTEYSHGMYSFEDGTQPSSHHLSDINSDI
jgi:hypothetical protein